MNKEVEIEIEVTKRELFDLAVEKFLNTVDENDMNATITIPAKDVMLLSGLLCRQLYHEYENFNHEDPEELFKTFAIAKQLTNCMDILDVELIKICPELEPHIKDPEKLSNKIKADIDGVEKFLTANNVIN